MKSVEFMKIPNKINPCPIVEALVEVRFDSILPDEAVFGVIYNEFRKDYPEITKLPILQLPEAIRNKDPNLAFQPHYQLQKDSYLMQIGPKVVSFANVNDYVGWGTFSEVLFKILKRLISTEIIQNISRLGLRYINVFDNLNVFNKSSLKIFLGNIEISQNDINLNVILPSGNFKSRLMIANNAKVDLKSQGRSIIGSIIDIDVFMEKSFHFKEIEGLIENAHAEEKKLFFTLLDPQFIRSLNPEY